MNIALETSLAKLPMDAIIETVQKYIRPLAEQLPDKRLERVVEEMILGILGGETPVVTAMARQNTKSDGESWATAKRIYRFLDNRHFPTCQLYEGLYQVGCQAVARERPAYLVTAIDPVNFEKPYAFSLEGISTVHKATPPDLAGHARLARGYPAITGNIVNTQVPVTSYANWFSYQLDFRSQNYEIEQALVTTCRLYPDHRVRFVGDSGLDDHKVFAQVGRLGQEFVFRVSHGERIVEVYNERLDRWEREVLQDLVESVLYTATFQVLYRHAGRSRLDQVQLGWFAIRLPEQREQPLWVAVVENPHFDQPVVLITNVPLDNLTSAQQIYQDWRLRGRIEHGYRFDQEQGLDVEDMRVRTLERMRRLFAMVLLAAQLVFVIAVHWPPQAVLWLRQLGGKLGLSSDRDGPYWLLRGISAVIVTTMTLSFVFLHPFPFGE
ncbi:MAG TPA: transposase, partial [Anaerolineaceae bacterium]|nr:transposase [Anaerolineaceae bacterium]